MAKPVILAIDDDHEVLAAIASDLRRHYRDDYRVMSASSGPEALAAVQELKKRDASIALFIVDQRMPQMTGTEFLVEARKLFPDAKRVLLTAYADSEAAIAAINQVGLHHYLRKPWEPPDQRLYPVLDDLLAEWRQHAKYPYEGLRVAGSRWSPQSYNTREFLSRNQVPYQWIDLDDDGPMRELVIKETGGLSKLPVVLFPDGNILVAPSNTELAARVGMHTLASLPFYDLVIVGAGPSGLACAVYGASEGLKVLVVEPAAPGGQAGTSSLIENYLGFPSGVSGADLAHRAATQARRFGAEILAGHSVVGVRRDDPYRFVQLSNGTEVSCHALVIATGMSVRELDIPGVAQLVGAGVYYGAAAGEVAMHRGRHMCIVGAANSAGQGALFCSRAASQVTILVRAAKLADKMSRYLVDRIEATDNITVLNHVELTNVYGQGHLERVDVKHVESGELQTLETAALFIFIGAAPRSQGFAGMVDVDEKGFILTGSDVKRLPGRWLLPRDPLMFETSIPGVFAVGDVRSGANRRIAAAVGEGSAAIFSVHQYLRTV